MKHLLESWQEYINEVNMGFDMTKSIEYTAFVLDDTSHKKLAAMAPEGWTVKAHHMTIIRPHEMKSGRLDSRWLELEGCFKIISIAQNDQVITALVDLGDLPLPMKGPTMPHVTIAVNPATGGKAEMSNAFQEQDYNPIEPIEICGTVEEVLR
jgi:hypothetical protein